MKPESYIFVGKWGKQEQGHPLIFHLLDSAATAEGLWQQGLTDGSRQQFCRWLQLDQNECGRLLAYWTSLHDLGKATPAFQRKHAPTRAKLEESGFLFRPLADLDVRHHSLLSQWILKELQGELGIQPPRIANQFRFAIGGHHGQFHLQQDGEQSLARNDNLGNQYWAEAQRDLLINLRTFFNPPALPKLSLSQAEQNAFFNLLTGFFVTADWLASQDDPFVYEQTHYALADYWPLAQERTQIALDRAGWISWQPDDSTSNFVDLFGFAPRALQQKAMDALAEINGPFLAIIEAPTGCGKTEAALMAVDRAIQNGKLRGCYIAMPTQATSNQMHERTRKFLAARYTGQRVMPRLAHGAALLNEEYQKLRLAAIEDEDSQVEGGVNAQDWFAPRKRTLLAPFGVGTVDQTFLGVLRAKHSFLRLFGLHRKVVVFDEVHAYDVYMLELFERLLGWLQAMGCPVILLSATLPEITRHKLLTAYHPEAVIADLSAPYPRISINDGASQRALSLGEFPDREVRLERITRDRQPAATGSIDEHPTDETQLVALLKEKLADGGCVAVVCNTVDRAQQMFAALQKAEIVSDEDLHLLHARMPYCWREKKERVILANFGKLEEHAKSPRRGIVVATQIIEQSLDLDFDLLITDLAPVDYLIQRIGRLQRHDTAGFPPLRPARLTPPTCVVFEPANEAGEVPAFGVDGFVYHPAILLRTYFTLHGKDHLCLPCDSDELVNQVYSTGAVPGCSADQMAQIENQMAKMDFRQGGEQVAAHNRLIGDVNESNAVGGQAAYLREEDSAQEQAALTRNASLPTVQLLCLVEKDGHPTLLDSGAVFDLSQQPHGETLKQALRSLVSVSKQEVVKYFWHQSPVAAWKKTPQLRRVQPAKFVEGRCSLENGLTLYLDEKLGLVIEK